MTRKDKRVILKTIKEYMESDDIEMARLGALLLVQHYPKRRWAPILGSLARQSGNWYYSLSNKDIEIHDNTYIGLYQNLTSSSVTYSYNPATFTLSTFSEAITHYFNNKQNKTEQDEQTKEQTSTESGTLKVQGRHGTDASTGGRIRAESKILEGSVRNKALQLAVRQNSARIRGLSAKRS